MLSATVLHAQGRSLVRAVVDDSGSYSIQQADFDWKLKGRGPFRVSKRVEGSDRLGDYSEYRLEWNPPSKLTGRIRVYGTAQTVLFTISTPTATTQLPQFPSFHQIPDALHVLSYRELPYAPHAWSGEQNGTPWVLFDEAGDTCVLSAASDFLVSRMWGDGRHEIGSGLNWQLTSIPAGFEHSSILVFGKGVVPTVRAWGRALTTLGGRTTCALDSEPLLKSLGYWTDRGAHYYYSFDPDKGYAGTLEMLRQNWRKKAIPVRYLQLDSWWYPKADLVSEKKDGTKVVDLSAFGWQGIGNTWLYQADPAVLPDGLSGLQQVLDLPLIVEGKGVDPKSPLAQTYHIAGTAPIDQGYWETMARLLFDCGVVCYEQDYLSEIYKDSPGLPANLENANLFTSGMTSAMSRYGITMQYSMALPRFFLEATRFSNITTARTSADRFERSGWDDFIYASLLARACGMWPSADVCRSTEPDNLLVETLSAGTVGIGDEIGTENLDNIHRVARADGAIVKPDETLAPTEDSLIGDSVLSHEPLVAWTYSDHAMRTAYVFAFARKHDAENFSFTPSEFGLTGQVYVYDYFAATGRLVNATQSYSDTVGDSERSYYIVAPVSGAGIALVGDTGKFVPCGRQRIPRITDTDGHLGVTIEFANPDQDASLTGYSIAPPKVISNDGVNDAVQYDPATKLFTIAVRPKEQTDDALVHDVTIVLDGRAAPEPPKANTAAPNAPRVPFTK